jgi:hypothetical protein
MTVYFLLFRSVHEVLKAEEVLKEGGFDFELVPNPRNLSSDCGMCIKLKSPLREVRSSIGDMAIDRCFALDGTEFREVSS